jgi:hypothetical protein
MTRLGLFAILSVVALVFLSGCGDQSSEGDVKAKAKAQADYVKEHPDPPGAGARG